MFVACFALVTLLALAGAFFYGRFRLKEGQLAPGPMVLLVQGNVPQTEKFRRETESEILDRHLALTLSHKGESLDLVVWSETMAPGIPSDDAEVQELFSLLARKMNANVLVGGIGAAGEDEYTNSAFFFRKSVASTLSGRYDKIHLVPFGEFLPFRRFLPWVAARLPYRHDLVAGKERSVFSLDGRTFSPLICYEDTDGPLVRSFKKKGVDFFVLITNDAWFGETSELDQHLASTVFRAIESRSPFARCANTGISCFVDSTGEVRGVLKGPRGKDRAEAASASSVLLLDSRTPLYLRVGDVFARACLVLTLLAFLPFRRLFQVLS